jgi:hypothetical protein
MAVFISLDHPLTTNSTKLSLSSIKNNKASVATVTMSPFKIRKRKGVPSDGGSDSDLQRRMPAQRRAPVGPSIPFETCTIHRVHCGRVKNHQYHPSVAYFEDAPRLFAGDSRASALRGSRPIPNISDFVTSHSDIGFIIYRYYDCEDYHRMMDPQFRPLEKPDDPVTKAVMPYFYRLDSQGMPAKSRNEAMLIPSKEFQDTIYQLTGMNSESISRLEDPESMREFITQIYHYRGIREHSAVAEKLGERCFDIAVFLVEFMETIFGEEYGEADALFSKGLVTEFHRPKLFAAQDLLVTKDQSQPCAYVLNMFQKDSSTVSCWAWRFDGRFWKHDAQFSVNWPGTQDMVAITDLPIYPLRYAPPDTHQLLKSRGHQFWSVRHGKYISYAPTGIQKDGHDVSI